MIRFHVLFIDNEQSSSLANALSSLLMEFWGYKSCMVSTFKELKAIQKIYYYLIIITAGLKCSVFLQEDTIMWTDEKHNIFLEHLEVSFVKQLHQSISLLEQNPDQDKGERCITQKHQINVDCTSKQLGDSRRGCWKRIKCNRGYPLSHVSGDSIGHSQRVYRNKRIGMKRPAASASTPEPLTLCNAENVQQVSKPHGLDTCSHQSCASTKYCDSHDSEREGTGQNFAVEYHESNLDAESRAKRMKTVSPD